MKYRDISHLFARIPEEWKAKSAEILAELAAAPSIEERKKIIKENSSHWSKIKRHLADISKNKCWYSEKKLTQTEMEIEHFRPKSRVQGITHDGYWWLAFDFRNYRLSSPTCNKKMRNSFNEELDVAGKGFEFPILNEATRVSDPNIHLSDTTFQLGEESPLLLDPIVNEDAMLLGFNYSDGKIVIADELYSSDVCKKRCKISIDTYNLNSSSLRPERFKIVRDLEGMIAELKDLLMESMTDENKQKVRRKVGCIGQKLTDDSEFSSFARGYVIQRLSDFPYGAKILALYH